MKATEQKAKRKFLNFLQYVAATTLWDGPLPKPFQYSMIVISNIQIISLLFQNRLEYLPVDKGIAKSLAVALNLVTMSDITSERADSTYIASCIVFAVAYFVIFLLLFWKIIQGYFSSKQISKKRQEIATIIGQIHLAFSFSVINMFLLRIVQNISAYSRLENWIICFAISVIILLNFSIGFFLTAFSYDPFTKLNTFSCHSTQFQVNTFIIKASLTLITSFVDDIDLRFYFVTGLSLALLAQRHYDLLVNFPFYQYNAMRTALVINSICLGTSCVNIITIILQQYDTYNVNDTVYIEVIFTLITSWLWNSIFNKEILCSLQMSDNKLKSQGQILKKLFALTHFMSNTKILIGDEFLIGRNELYFWGVLTSLNESNNKTYTHEHFLSEGENDLTSIVDRKRFLKIREHVVKDFLRTATGKLRNSDKIRTILLSKCVNDPRYLMTSMSYLVSLSKSNNFKTKIIVSKLKSRLEYNLAAFFEDQKKQKFEVKAFVDFETISEKFVRMIYTNTQTHLSFWKTYSKADIEIMKLGESTKLFESNNDKIHRFWTKEIEPNRLFASLLVDVYHVYLSHIRNMPVTASKLQKKINVINGWKLQHDEIISSHGTLIMHVSMSKERAGNILYASPHIEEVLGRPSHSLIGKSINTLIPPFIREKHEENIRKLLENIKDPGSRDFMGHTKDAYILDQSGHIIPCRVHLSLSPYIQSELVYIVVLKVQEKVKDDYIIMGKDSYVEAFTEEIGYHLNLSTGKRIFMPDICQNYHELKKTMTKLESYHGHTDDTGNHFSVTPPQPDQGNVNLTLSFHRYRKSTQETQFYETQLTTQIFCQTPMYVLRMNKISKETEKDDDKSELISPGNKKATDEESDTSSNRVFEENLNEHAKVPATFEPLSARQNSSRRLIEITPRLQSDLHQVTEASQRNRLVSFDKSEHEKVKSHRPARDERKKTRKANAVQKQFERDEDQSVSVFAGREYNRKVENAIHSVPKDKKFTILKVIGIVLIIMSTAAVVGWQSYNDKLLGYVSGNIEVMSQTKYMLVQLVRLNRIARFVVLIDENLLLITRYLPYSVITNLKATVAAPVRDLSSSANVYSNNIKNALYKIDPSLQKQLYQAKYTINHLVNTTTLGTVQKANIFDLVTEIVSEGLKVGNAPQSEFNRENLSVQFVLNNTLNDLLIGGESIIPILMQDNQGKLESLTTLVAILFSIMTVISVVIARAVYIIIIPFVRKRNHFMSILMRIDSGPVEEHIGMVTKFLLAIERSYFSSRSENLSADKHYFRPLNTRLLNSKHVKKSADNKGIHKSLYSHSFVILIFMSAVLAIYIALYGLNTAQARSIISKVDLMTTSEHYLYQLVLLYCMQYAYIDLNKSTTVRGNPIAEEWQQTYQNFTEAQGFLSGTFLNDMGGVGTSDRAVQIVQGNLCPLMNITASAATLCNILQAGLLQGGLINLNSFHLAGFQDTISSFDNSQGTHDQLVQILNSPTIASEDIMSYYFTDKAYKLVTDLMQELLKDDISEFQNSFKILIFIYIAICILAGIVVWMKICNSLEKEMDSWNKIVRQIPWEIIINNKFLKRLLSLN